MNSKEDKIAEIFREKLNNWAPEPPKGVWEAIQAAQQRRRRLVIYRITAIAAALLLLISLPFVLQKQESTTLPATQTAEVSASDTGAAVEAPGATASDNAIELSQAKDSGKLYTTQTAPQRPENIQHSVDLQSVGKTELAAVVDPQENTESIRSEDTSPVGALTQVPLSDEAVRMALDEMLEKLKEENIAELVDYVSGERNKTALAFNYNFAPASIVGQNGLFNNILNYRYGPDPFQGRMVFDTRFLKDIDESRLEAPLSLGFRVSLPLSRKLAFETGLVYTKLNTYTRTFPLDGVYLEYNQTLLYLGVPVGMRYEFVQTRLVNLYTAQHVTVEKGVAAINTVNKYQKDNIIGRERLYENISGIQLSTTTSLGAGLNLHRYISLYGEGGLQIFYLNHTQPFNIRSSKKLWPVYQSGIRVNL